MGKLMCENQANYGLNVTFSAIPTPKKWADFLYIFLCAVLHIIFFLYKSYVIREIGKCFLLCSTKEL